MTRRWPLFFVRTNVRTFVRHMASTHAILFSGVRFPALQAKLSRLGRRFDAPVRGLGGSEKTKNRARIASKCADRVRYVVNRNAGRCHGLAVASTRLYVDLEGHKEQ